MSDPVAAVRESIRQILQTQHAGWRDIVTGLSADALNWKPGDETNSIAVLISHALDAERFLLATSVDAEIDRDRDAKFRVNAASGDELVAIVDQTESDINGYLDALTADHLGQEVVRGARTHTGSWWLLHAVEHSCEHLGQASLTKQMWEQQQG
jgi:uncharacterized damage-inducible protein DinB